MLAVVRAMYLTLSDQNMNAQEQESRKCLLQAHPNGISPPKSVDSTYQVQWTRPGTKGVDLAGKSGCPCDIQSGNSICVFISTERKELFGGIAC